MSNSSRNARKDSSDGSLADNDIQPARRQPAEISLDEIERSSAAMRYPPQKKKSAGPVLGLLLLAGIAGLGAWQWDRISLRVEGMKRAIASGTFPLGEPEQTAASESASEQSSEPAITSNFPADQLPPIPADLATNPPSTSPSGATSPPDTLLNHRRYAEASPDSLIALNPNSALRLQPAAQASLNAMMAKAKAEGVQLGVVSAFRSLEDQDYLYFKVKAERGQSAKTRAEVSAPPGYSEHHTGYAVDLIDESKPNTHLEESFETTAAYQWLEKNAAFFNFELSFPKNADGTPPLVAYEPWHWRYVGDQDSLETFYAP